MPFEFEYNFNYDSIFVKKKKKNLFFQPIWQPYSVRMRKLADETHVSSKQRCDI